MLVSLHKLTRKPISPIPELARRVGVILALSSTLLRDGPRYGRVSHAPLLGDRPGTLAFGDALPSDATLQLGQLGLATHMHTTLAGCSSAVVGTLHDPLAFVLREGAQERDEAATDGRGEGPSVACRGP